MSFDQDLQFQSEKISRVEPSTCGDEPGWFLTFEEGFGIWCPSKHCAQAPVPGETARLYGKGFGYHVRGIVVDGRIYRYRTVDEAEEDFRQEQLARKREQQERFERERPMRDARRAALPLPFQLRLNGFEEARADWRRDCEPYELFCCEEAVKLAKHFPTIEQLLAFSKLGYSEQKEAAPELAWGEHSGNTWGHALKFAAGYLQTSALLPQFHAAICALIGCEEAGCHAARGKEGSG